MPKEERSVLVRIAGTLVAQAVERLIADRRWRVAFQKAGTSAGSGMVVFEEVSGGGFSWPARMTLRFVEMPNYGGTSVSVIAENSGFGPLQAKHLKNQVEALMQRLEMHTQALAAERNAVQAREAAAVQTRTLAEQLDDLSRLFDRGSLTQEEFTVAKQRLLQASVTPAKQSDY